MTYRRRATEVLLMSLVFDNALKLLEYIALCSFFVNIILTRSRSLLNALELDYNGIGHDYIYLCEWVLFAKIIYSVSRSCGSFYIGETDR